jgi:hypothetical protein
MCHVAQGSQCRVRFRGKIAQCQCRLKKRHLENLFVVPKGILPEEFPRDAVVFPEPEDLHESQRWLLVGAAVA